MARSYRGLGQERRTVLAPSVGANAIRAGMFRAAAGARGDRLNRCIAFELLPRRSSDPVPPNLSRRGSPLARAAAGRTRQMNGKTQLGLGDAAAVAGVSRTTLLRAIRSGEISAARHKNAFVIDASELARAFPQTRQDALQDAPRRDPAREPDEPGEVREMKARLEAAEAAIRFRDEMLDDLRRRLDRREADHRMALDRLAAAQERITALLTDQRTTVPPPGRRWRLWGRPA
jgi:hypothetical protein